MRRALIGHTGFVGSNLDRQMTFDKFYNSKNIEEIRGQKFDEVYISAAPAEKWRANKEPENDLEILGGLMANLAQVEMREAILISTVDVYPAPRNVDEDSAIDLAQCHAYGKHRLMLEQFLIEKFDTSIIRLPGLFGKGLKKNIIYDFLKGNQVENIHPLARFQFYYLEHLADDIGTMKKSGIKLLNLATEPVSVGNIASEAFGLNFDNDPGYDPPLYDFHTKHAATFGKRGPYLYDGDQVINEITEYVIAEGWKRP